MNNNEQEFSVIDDRLIFLGRRSIDFNQILIDKEKNNWLSNFKNSKNLYLIHPSNERSIEETRITYENFQPFRYLKKDIPIGEITWKIVFNESLVTEKIKLFQLGKKTPKRFNEINENLFKKQKLWIDNLLDIDNLIKKNEITIIGDFDSVLWSKYVEKAMELRDE